MWYVRLVGFFTFFLKANKFDDYAVLYAIYREMKRKGGVFDQGAKGNYIMNPGIAALIYGIYLHLVFKHPA